MNFELKGFRNLSITALVKAMYFRLAKLFATNDREAYARKAAENVFSKAIMT